MSTTMTTEKSKGELQLPISRDSRPQREMQVLALGLPRTGSTSMMEALTILGYQDVYHLIKAIDRFNDWHVLDRAADASFPVLPSYTGEPFTRAQWDELFGPCEAVTEVASLFSPQMIRAYPDAKVVLVIRDFDKWIKSIEEGVFGGIWSPAANFSIEWLEPLMGFLGGKATRKMILGYFEAHDVDEARRNARAIYDQHHERIRSMVPPEQLLEYRMGDGWAPLCKFLGKPIPDEQFPWVNDAAAMKKIITRKIQSNLVAASGVVAPWLAGAGAVGAIAWWATKRTGVLL